jgi:hypothetical protein
MLGVTPTPGDVHQYPERWAINPGNNDGYVFSTRFPGGTYLPRTCDGSGYCSGTSYVADFGTVTELYIL